MDRIIIRHAKPEDSNNLLSLMKKLAVFEEYIDAFKVTEKDLLQHGFQSSPTYTAIVAEESNADKKQLVAYLVYYLIPFTYDLKPTLFIKELWAESEYRGQQIGTRLMQAALLDAKNHQCGRIKWDVLANNKSAQKFYQSLQGYYDKRWQGYVLDGSEFNV